ADRRRKARRKDHANPRAETLPRKRREAGCDRVANLRSELVLGSRQPSDRRSKKRRRGGAVRRANRDSAGRKSSRKRSDVSPIVVAARVDERRGPRPRHRRPRSSPTVPSIAAVPTAAESPCSHRESPPRKVWSKGSIGSL